MAVQATRARLFDPKLSELKQILKTISQPPSLGFKELCVVTTFNANQEGLVKLQNAAAVGYVGAPNRFTSNSGVNCSRHR